MNGLGFWHPFRMRGVDGSVSGGIVADSSTPGYCLASFQLADGSSGIPSGCGIVGLGFRGYRRGAPQPPATVWQAFSLWGGGYGIPSGTGIGKTNHAWVDTSRPVAF